MIGSKLIVWVSLFKMLLISLTATVGGTQMEVIPKNIHHLERVFVLWSNVSDYSSKDRIGFYCPPGLSDNDPMDLVPSGANNGTLIAGPMLNIRQECQFRYLRQNGSSYYADGASGVLSFKNAAVQPLHIRLSATENPGEMAVVWVSNTTTPPPYVLYSAGGKETKTIANSTTYAASDMCESPATETLSKWFINPGWIHRAVMIDLPADTQVKYQVGNDKMLSMVRIFRTPHPSRLQAFIIADLGEWVTPIQGYAVDRSHETVNNIVMDLYNTSQDYHLLVHAGDISYARGKAYQWEQFGALVEPVSSAVPYMITIGNHEYDHETDDRHKDPSGASGAGWHPSWGNFGTDSAGECGLPVARRFSVPRNGNGVFWYYYQYGPAWWIHFSSEHDFTPGSTQYQWLNTTLRAINRSVIPWVFVVAHRPMYCSLNNYPNTKVMYGLQQYLEDMFYHYQVDVFWTGHFHAYERTCPLYRQNCQSDGVTHIMTGMAGASLDQSKYFYVPWSIYRDSSSFGYGRLHIYNRTHLNFEYVANANRTVKDSVWIVRDHSHLT